MKTYFFEGKFFYKNSTFSVLAILNFVFFYTIQNVFVILKNRFSTSNIKGIATSADCSKPADILFRSNFGTKCLKFELHCDPNLIDVLEQ